MAKPSMNTMRTKIGSFAPVYKWDIDLTPVTDLLGGLNLSPTSVNPEVLSYLCSSVSVPIVEQEKITVALRGHKMNQQGIHNYSGSIELTFVEDQNRTVAETFRQWREACWQTNTGSQFSRHQVQTTLDLVMLSMDEKDGNFSYLYRLYGCFLEGFDPGGAPDSETSDVFRPVVTISYDSFKEGRTAADLKLPDGGYSSED